MRILRVLLLLNLLYSPEIFADKKSVLEAIQGLDGINGFEADAEVTAIPPAFAQLPAHPEPTAIEGLFEEQGIASWSGILADYLSLSQIMYESLDAAEQKAQKMNYEAWRATVADFQGEVTRYVLGIHPGFTILGIESLQKDFTGRGVRVAVFDSFEAEILEAQKTRYPKAQWLAPVKFGNPVALNHGNTVIDIILQLAPEATILPVSAESKYYAEAMEAIAARSDIDLLNMSRAFAEDAKTKTIDARFKAALRSFSSHGILVKALGNTGTDLDGALNSRRVAKGLGPVNTITSYDLKLIRDLYAVDETGTHFEVYAENLALFADDIALTATVPGIHARIQERTLGVPAEGIYSPSSGTFESGSSFAAPQLTAWLALLLQRTGSVSAAYAAVFAHADLKGHDPAEWGRGVPKP